MRGSRSRCVAHRPPWRRSAPVLFAAVLFASAAMFVVTTVAVADSTTTRESVSYAPWSQVNLDRLFGPYRSPAPGVRVESAVAPLAHPWFEQPRNTYDEVLAPPALAPLPEVVRAPATVARRPASDCLLPHRRVGTDAESWAIA